MTQAVAEMDVLSDYSEWAMVTSPTLSLVELEACLNRQNDATTLLSQKKLHSAVKAMRAKRYRKAVEHFTSLLAQSQLSLAMNLFSRFQGAQCLVNGLIHGQYDDSTTLDEQASIALSNQLLAQAEGWLNELMVLSPMASCSAMYLAYAKIHRLQGRYQSALTSLRRALTDALDIAAIHFDCAQLCDILGLTDQARQHFNEAIAADPMNEMIMRRYTGFLKHRRIVMLPRVLPVNHEAQVYSGFSNRPPNPHYLRVV